MVTQFIAVVVPLPAAGASLPQAVEAFLRQRGQPLRWAITAVDAAAQTAQVEAVITLDGPEL